AYQWYLNNSPIAGATSETYIPNTTGDFFLEVTKGNCTYTSNTLHANPCKIITNRGITHRIKNW
ncbi:MAG: hypothetical protein AAGA86_06400, partial [Bacteroidota bacterium]